MTEIDWNEYGVFRIVLSHTFFPFGRRSVTIYRKGKAVMVDMSPKILRRCRFPATICSAAESTVADGKDRHIDKEGRIIVKEPLDIPPDKPKLIIPAEKPKLVIPGDD